MIAHQPQRMNQGSNSVKVLSVTVYPESRKNRVEKVGLGRYTVFTKAKAQNGLANIKVKEMLARELNIELKQIKMTAGHQSGKKLFKLLV